MKINFLKENLYLVIFISIFGIFVLYGMFSGISNNLEKDKCLSFIKNQIPTNFIFGENYIIKNDWNDGTKIKTLKDFNSIDRTGILTDIKKGNFNFYKGNKVGQNKNKYYIASSMLYGSEIGAEIKDTGESFYFIYEGEQKVNNEGLILPKKTFKINVEKYEVEKINRKYYFKLLNYNVETCENINLT